MGIGFETIDGGIAGFAPGFGPIFDDAEFAGMVEEAIDGTDDDKVEIEEECGAGEIGEGRGKSGKFAPTAFLAFGQIHGWELQRLNSFVEASGIVGEANETVRASEVARNHRVKTVHVFGAEFRAPFHADDVHHARRRIGRRVESQKRKLITYCTRVMFRTAINFNFPPVSLKTSVWPSSVTRQC